MATTAIPQPIGTAQTAQIDRGLIELATALKNLGIELRRLQLERDTLADGRDKRALQYNRHLLGEANESWWVCAGRVVHLPAQSLGGLRLKAATIIAVQVQRDTNPLVNDCTAADVQCRLALSLADDIRVLYASGRLP